jgi:hypothetical protein
MHWAILTGEFPPKFGGVSDYTAILARALAASGDEVTVICPDSPDSAADGVTLHGLAGHWRGAAFERAREILERVSPDRVLVQYTPQAFGMYGANLRWARWLRRIGRSLPIDVMVHEAVFVTDRRWSPLHRALEVASSAVSRSVFSAADRIFCSTSAWFPCIRRLIGEQRSLVNRPIFSNLPTVADAPTVAAMRKRLGLQATQVVGHFGTFGPAIRSRIVPVLKRMLLETNSQVLLIGGGGHDVKRQLETEIHCEPHRVVATGRLDASDAVAAMSCCHLAIQAFPDGANSRRSSLIAWLPLGIPVVCNAGENTEPIWQASKAICLAHTPESMCEQAFSMLGNPAMADNYAKLGRKFYDDVLDVRHTVNALRHLHAAPQIA